MRTKLIAALGGTSVLVPALLAPAAVAAPTPAVRCVAPDADGTGLVGYWGYTNTGPDATMPVPGAGALANRFTTGDADRGQPTVFPTNAPAIDGYGDDQTQLAVSVPFTGTLTWRLDGVAATASATSAKCGFDAGLTLTADRAGARPGDTISWTLTLRNNGSTPFPWRNVALTPTGGLRIGDPATPVPDELLANEAIDLPAGRTVVPPSACFDAVAPSVTGAFQAPLIRTPDANPADNTARRSVPVNCTVDLQVVAPFDRSSYAPGDTATRTATVSNVGQAPVPLTAIAVRDSAMGPYTGDAANPAILNPGATAVFRVARALPSTGDACAPLSGSTSLTVGDASGRYVDADTSSNTWTSSSAVAGGACVVTPQPAPSGGTQNTPTAKPRVNATVSAPTRVRQGGLGVYRVTVTNPGPAPMAAVAVALSVPKRVIINQRLARRDVRTGNTVWRRVPSLAAGKKLVFTLKVRYPRGYLGKRRTLVRVYARDYAMLRTVPVTQVLR